MTGFPVLMHTALDALDARALAEFYRELLGLQYRPGDAPPTDGSVDDADWLVLVDDHGRRQLAFQQVASLARATWPSDDVPKQMHLDLRVPTADELERQRGRAEELGATVLYDRTHEKGEALYVFADPAGHPFCILVGPEYLGEVLLATGQPSASSTARSASRGVGVAPRAVAGGVGVSRYVVGR